MDSRTCAARSAWRAPAAAHSGDCQFYVNVADNADLDPLPTRWGYAVFGRVIEGMEVVDRISVSPTGAMGPFKQDAPLQPVIIQKVELMADAAPGRCRPRAAAPAGRRAEPPAAEPAAAADACRPTPPADHRPRSPPPPK